MSADFELRETFGLIAKHDIQLGRLPIHRLDGENIASLIASGRKFAIPEALTGNGGLMSDKRPLSRTNEVAIDPRKLVKQENPIHRIRNSVYQTASIDELATVYYQHLDRTGEPLFRDRFARSHDWFGGALCLGLRASALDPGVVEIGYAHPGYPDFWLNKEFFENSWTPTLAFPADTGQFETWDFTQLMVVTDGNL